MKPEIQNEVKNLYVSTLFTKSYHKNKIFLDHDFVSKVKTQRF